LSDPLFNLTLFQKELTADKKYYLNKLIRHVFNIWKLKELMLTNSEVKILLLLPVDLNLINSSERKRLLTSADEKFIVYINRIFNRNFKDVQSCLDFLSRLETSKDLFSNIKNFDLLPNKFKQFNSLNEFLTEFSSTARFAKIKKTSVGGYFGVYLYSQFIRVQEHKFFCDKLVAEPIYDDDLPWFFFNYEIGGLDMDAAIANALQKENFNWISNIPISVLKIFREENKLDYMRNIIRTGITDLKAKNDKELLQISKQIDKNFKEAFKRQNSELKSLEKEVKKITKKEIPIVTSGFLVGLIPYLTLPISIVSAARDIYRLIKEHKKIKNEINKKENNFISLLMKSYERR
jgi:hypothetical protein